VASAEITGPPPAPELARFWVREGYVVEPVIDQLPGARFLEFDDRGTLFVSRPGGGKSPGDVTAFRDADGDGYYETRTTFVTGFPQLHGLCWYDGWLYFAHDGAVRKARDANGDGVADDVIEVLADLPRGTGHWWRSLLVTDRFIYTSIGDSGNITDETDSPRQKIWRYSISGADKTLFASGIRNTEKLRLRPGTDEVWGCDHGSDNLGRAFGETGADFQPITDKLPPCELNRYVEGGFYGHPFIVGMRYPRPEYAKRPDIAQLAARTIVPEWCFGAHWAPNGHCFVDPAKLGKAGPLPADHAGDLFVAFHGSWNSSEKVGYQVARVCFDRGHPCGLLTIVKTVSDQGQISGRPVDCVQAPDGSILFSDDWNGRVYRLRGQGTAGTGGR
jgi:glucose/arabinose dehydrogenase